MKRLTHHLFIIIVLTLALQGCFFVAGAAAGAAAIAIVYDHRTLSNALTDGRIAKKISDKIKFEPPLRDESHIEVTVFNRVVLLTGETPNPAWREQAGELAKSVAGVSRVYNQIQVQGPTSSLTRTSDSWVTAKIKSEMLTASNLKSSSIKVVTESGTVYLMGIVNRQQADIAVEIARQVSGVQRVIKIFQYKN
jgi:osmotically-inducible protein OsmY